MGGGSVGHTHGTSPEQLVDGRSLPTVIWPISRIAYFEENERTADSWRIRGEPLGGKPSPRGHDTPRFDLGLLDSYRSVSLSRSGGVWSSVRPMIMMHHLCWKHRGISSSGVESEALKHAKLYFPPNELRKG